MKCVGCGCTDAEHIARALDGTTYAWCSACWAPEPEPEHVGDEADCLPDFRGT